MHLFLVCIISIRLSAIRIVVNRHTAEHACQLLKYFQYVYASWEIARPWMPYSAFHALEGPAPLPETSRSPYHPANRRKMKGTAERLQDPNLMPRPASF